MLASGCAEVDATSFPMKIVHVETGRHFYGGAQQVTWLLEGLAGRGVESTLVCPEGAAIDEIARGAGLTVVNLPCRGEADFGFPVRLHRLLRRERPDLLHCHSRRGADFPGGWAAVSSGIPAIVTRRVDSPEAPTAAAIRYFPFERVVAISDNVAAALRKSRVRERKLAIVRSAVDVDAIATDVDREVLHREFGVSVHGFAIAVVAQLIRRKGHRFMLDVLPGLVAERPGTRVVFFGEGSEENPLRDLAARLGVYDAVHFAGFRPDLDDFLAAFDLVVHPAEKEGLGVAMLKAAAARLPVVAFDVAGCSEAVEHMRTGILVPPGDLSALQTAIAVLIDEPELRERMGAAGRKRMEDDFSVSSMVESYIGIYKGVLNGRA